MLLKDRSCNQAADGADDGNKGCQRVEEVARVMQRGVEDLSLVDLVVLDSGEKLVISIRWFF